MTAKTNWRAVLVAVPFLAAAPALAQDAEEQGRPYDRNSLTIGAGEHTAIRGQREREVR